MQGVDSLDSDAPCPFLPPPADHPLICATCKKSIQVENQYLGVVKKDGSSEVFCVPNCVPTRHLRRYVEKLCQLKQQCAKDIKALKKENMRLQQITEVLDGARKRYERMLQRIKKKCEKKKECTTCVKAVSITRPALVNEGEPVNDLVSFSKTHPISIGETSYAFCTTCRGLEPKSTSDKSVLEDLAEFHYPTVRVVTNTRVVTNAVDAWHPLTLKFCEHPVAAQSNGSMLSE
jgi:hypothetical protein